MVAGRKCVTACIIIIRLLRQGIGWGYFCGNLVWWRLISKPQWMQELSDSPFAWSKLCVWILILIWIVILLKYSWHDLVGYDNSSRHQEIPGSNPGQDWKSCWPNGKAPDYGVIIFCFVFTSQCYVSGVCQVIHCHQQALYNELVLHQKVTYQSPLALPCHACLIYPAQ